MWRARFHLWGSAFPSRMPRETLMVLHKISAWGAKSALVRTAHSMRDRLRQKRSLDRLSSQWPRNGQAKTGNTKSWRKADAFGEFRGLGTKSWRFGLPISAYPLQGHWSRSETWHDREDKQEVWMAGQARHVARWMTIDNRLRGSLNMLMHLKRLRTYTTIAMGWYTYMAAVLVHSRIHGPMHLCHCEYNTCMYSGHTGCE